MESSPRQTLLSTAVGIRRGDGDDESAAANHDQQPLSPLTAVGFCGVDDSVHPKLLALVSETYPWVEWGVLFRPDKEGRPRYPTSEWRDRLGDVAALNPRMRLAAHLCGSHVNHLLNGDSYESSVFLASLPSLGYKRVQINATAVNGVDTCNGNMSEGALNLAEAMSEHPELEFILQRNEETRSIWETLIETDGEGCGPKGELPNNVSLLADESKGTGLRSASWPSPPPSLRCDSSDDNENDEDDGDGEDAHCTRRHRRLSPAYRMGYAGGINPDNVGEVLKEIVEITDGSEFWIDMESGVRSGDDFFDLNKCFRCIDEVCRIGFKSHPFNLR